jgi:hypothetical protein
MAASKRRAASALSSRALAHANEGLVQLIEGLERGIGTQGVKVIVLDYLAVAGLDQTVQWTEAAIGSSVH